MDLLLFSHEKAFVLHRFGSLPLCELLLVHIVDAGLAAAAAALGWRRFLGPQSQPVLLVVTHCLQKTQALHQTQHDEKQWVLVSWVFFAEELRKCLSSISHVYHTENLELICACNTPFLHKWQTWQPPARSRASPSPRPSSSSPDRLPSQTYTL